MFSLLLMIIYIAFVSLGLPDSLVGAAWPVMHRDLGVPVAFAGLVTMVIALGTVVSSIASDRLTKRLGTGLVTSISVGMTALALVGFSLSNHFALIIAFAIPYGLGAGAVDAALNNYVALHFASKHMSWLHCCWGIGAAVSPYIMGYAITGGHGWHAGYLIVGIIQIVLSLFLFVSLGLWRRHGEALAAAQEAPEHHAPIPLRRVLAIPGVMFMLLAFVCYSAVEQTTAVWASTFLVSARGVDAGLAASFASMFFLGITAGRFASGFFADRVGDRRMIRLGVAGMVLGALMVALPLGYVVALIGFVVVGLGCAPVYPAIIHATPRNFGAHRSQAVIGVQMAAAYTGTTVLPPLFGFVAQVTSVALLPYYLLLFGVLLLVGTEALNKVVDRRESEQVA